jgi:hypothetical protein
MDRKSRPERIEVTVNIRGEPVALNRNGQRCRVVAIYDRWHLTDEWWNKEQTRHYFRVKISQGFVCEIYHDVTADQWYLDRIFD